MPSPGELPSLASRMNAADISQNWKQAFLQHFAARHHSAINTSRNLRRRSNRSLLSTFARWETTTLQRRLRGLASVSAYAGRRASHATLHQRDSKRHTIVEQRAATHAWQLQPADSISHEHANDESRATNSQRTRSQWMADYEPTTNCTSIAIVKRQQSATVISRSRRPAAATLTVRRPWLSCKRDSSPVLQQQLSVPSSRPVPKSNRRVSINIPGSPNARKLDSGFRRFGFRSQPGLQFRVHSIEW